MAKLAYSKLKLKTNNSIETVYYTVNDEQLAIDVKTYLPIEEKVKMLERIINLAEDNMHFYNSIKLEVFLNNEILNSYTNISLTDTIKENPTKLYDETKNTIMPLILEVIEKNKEYSWLLKHLSELVDSIYKYNNSILGIMNTLTTDYSAIDENLNDIQDKIQDPNVLTVLKDVLTKLG